MKKTHAAMMMPLLLGLTHPAITFGQTYYFGAPVAGFQGSGSGYQEIPFADSGNPNFGPFGSNGGGMYPGFGSTLSFGTANGILVYNQAAGTMRLSGDVTLGSGSYSSTFSDNQTINGNLVPATVSVNYTIGNQQNGLLAFDTGVIQHASGDNNAWSLTLQVPVSGTYSLATGGQTYNGTFSYTLNLATTLKLQSFSAKSLTFSQDTLPDSESLSVALAKVTAENGVVMNLDAKDPSDGQTYVSWHLDNIIAQVSTSPVPEPSTLALLGCGLLGVGLLGRRGRSNGCK